MLVDTVMILDTGEEIYGTSKGSGKAIVCSDGMGRSGGIMIQLRQGEDRAKTSHTMRCRNSYRKAYHIQKRVSVK